jgi:hypothetical protein
MKPLEQSRKWLVGVIMQGERIIYALEEEPSNNELLECEKHFFIIALAKVIFWLQKLKSPLDEIKSYLDCFPEAKELRNMFEHDDEYANGKGRKQKKYRASITVNKGNLQINELLPINLMKCDEGLFLGGRISINTAIHSSRVLLAKLQE